MPAGMLRGVCCRADGVTALAMPTLCSLVAEASRNLPAGSPRRIQHQQGYPALATFIMGSPCAFGAGWHLACLTLQPAPVEVEGQQNLLM